VSRSYHSNDVRSFDHDRDVILVDVTDRQVKSSSDRDKERCISILVRMTAQQAYYDFDSRFVVTFFSEAENLNQYRKRAKYW